MRYPKLHKPASRQRLIAQCGGHAKRYGFSQSGMAALAGAAGVTTGALYKHFESKSDLLAAVITAEMARTAQFYADIATADSAQLAHAMAGYLSLAHVRNPEQGCPLPSLTPEVARAGGAAQAAYQTGLLAVHAQLARLTGSAESAWALMAQNVGAVMLARALPDENLQQTLLVAVRRAGETLHTECPLPPPTVD